MTKMSDNFEKEISEKLNDNYTWNDILEWLFSVEGTTFENDPDDAGGATKYGVDFRSLEYYSLNNNLEPFFPKKICIKTIKEMTEKQASFIYWNFYWKPLDAWKIGMGKLRLSCFDYRVNAGGQQCAKDLQRILGGLVVDGIVGKKTIARARAYIEEGRDAELADALNERRRIFYRRLVANKPKQAKFLRGWLNRVDRLEGWMKRMGL